MLNNLDDIMEQALQTKRDMDELALLYDKLYICLTCHDISDYWKAGLVCQACEAEGERQQEEQHED